MHRAGAALVLRWHGLTRSAAAAPAPRPPAAVVAVLEEAVSAGIPLRRTSSPEAEALRREIATIDAQLAPALAPAPGPPKAKKPPRAADAAAAAKAKADADYAAVIEQQRAAAAATRAERQREADAAWDRL